MNGWELDESERDEILNGSILPLMFPRTPDSESTPILILLAGQPGAGRSRAQSVLAAEHGPGVAIVSVDELRAFHPRFAELTSTAPLEAQEGIARATAGWVRDCIRYARESHRSLLLDGAFLDPAAAIGTAERFAEAGFQTRIVVVVSRRAESLLSATSLYLQDVRAYTLARFVSRDAHDRAFKATRALVAAAEQAASVDRLTVVNPAGQLVFDARREGSGDDLRGAGSALEVAQSSRLSRFDATQWLSELHHMADFAASRRDLPRGVTEVLMELHQIALREVIPELHVPSDGKFTVAIEQKTVSRLVELRRSFAREQAVDVAAPTVAPVGPERGGISR